MKCVKTPKAPEAIGPYSQGVVVAQSAKALYVSGQLPIDPKTGKMVDGDIKVLTCQVIDNIESILSSEGLGLHCVAKVEIFMTNLARDYAQMNEVYAERFSTGIPPARQAVEVTALPKSALLEISCIAYFLDSEEL